MIPARGRASALAAEDYTPPPWLPGRDLQTAVPALWPVRPLAGTPEQRWVPVAPGSEVLVLVDRPAVRRPRGSLVLLHGLGGSASSGYMIATARQALDRGWVTARMNLRNCGGTERRSTTLYNAAQSDDVDAVLRVLASRLPPPFGALGFSLGASLVLRYAGRAGATARAAAFVGINPPLDLARCVHELERFRNRLYHEYYVLRLRRMLRTVRRLREVPGPAANRRSLRTLRQFDEEITAPDAGYRGAADYYRDASAGPVLDGIRHPALVLSAANDPFVPREIFESFRGNSLVTFRLPAAGGHCGYWLAREPRYWAGDVALDFVERAVQGEHENVIATATLRPFPS